MGPILSMKMKELGSRGTDMRLRGSMKEDLSFKRMKVIMVEDEEEIKKQQIITKILKWGGHPSPKALVYQNLF